METARCQIRSRKTILFVLDTTTAGTLSSLDALLVGLDLTSLHRTHEATGSLPGASELTGGGLAEEVDLDEVALKGALEGNNRLDQERVGVLHVEMHESHHADTHHLALEEGLELLEIVGLDGGCDELGLLAGSHGRGLDVLDNSHVCLGSAECSEQRREPGCIVGSMQRTILLVDLHLNVEVDGGDDDVGDNVQGAHASQYVRVIEWDLLGDLHETPGCCQIPVAWTGACDETYSMMTRLVLR